MSLKTWVWLGLFIGSTIGAFVPSFFNASVFSFASQVWAAIGGLVGIWAGYKIGKNFSA